MKKITKLIIPLAGEGTRFAPSSTINPKELTHLVDKPVLQYLIEEAYDSGIKEVIFVLNFEKDSIVKYFSKKYQNEYIKKANLDLSNFSEDLTRLHNLLDNIKFSSVIKSKTLGDGHSLLLAKSFIEPDEPFAVSMGDLLGFDDVPFIKQLIRIYNKTGKPVISVERMSLEATSKFGVIKPSNSNGRIHQVVDVIEKPGPKLAPSSLVITGKYILTPDIFTYLENTVKNYKSGEVKLANVLKNYSNRNELYAYECEGEILDTGNILDFIKTTINIGSKHKKYAKEIKHYIKSLVK